MIFRGMSGMMEGQEKLRGCTACGLLYLLCGDGSAGAVFGIAGGGNGFSRFLRIGSFLQRKDGAWKNSEQLMGSI